MPRFQVLEEKRDTKNGLDGKFIILQDQEQTARAEIWPALGFNCVRWCSKRKDRTVEWLYASPQLLEETRPTRSGIPILFPFPNRIRDGRFTWDGKAYQLPLNDPTQKNAIHGFACRYPWRVVDRGADDDCAWVTGEFWASKDAPEVLNLWPADYKIRVTYRLRASEKKNFWEESGLKIEAVVENPDRLPLPFGLGYHPYFALFAAPEKLLVEVAANDFWQLQDSLPTSVRLPVDADRDLRKPLAYSQLHLDDILTNFSGDAAIESTNCWLRGRLSVAGEKMALGLLTTPDFGELVVFTPPHRQAICMEPYTCITDAVNLQPRGIDAGWHILPPGETWSGTVDLVGALNVATFIF